MHNNCFKVEVYDCPANLPFSLAKHSWFVVSEKDKRTRYEVLMRKNRRHNHIHINFLAPSQGIYILPIDTGPHFKSRKIATVKGDENSMASRMIKAIKESRRDYQYRKDYSLVGPNSNTYVQHILNKFPEAKIKLNKMALGKGYDETSKNR